MNYNFERYSGPHIYLSPFRKDPSILGLYTHWAQEIDLLPFMNESFHLVSGNQINQWTQAIANVCGRTLFNIIDRETGNVIGICLLLPFNSFSYELRIFLDKSFRNRHYGREAVNILCHIAFFELRAHRVFLHTHSLNRSALECFKACNFAECAVEHEVVYYNRQYYSLVHMELLEDSYVDITEELLGGDYE